MTKNWTIKLLLNKRSSMVFITSATVQIPMGLKQSKRTKLQLLAVYEQHFIILKL